MLTSNFGWQFVKILLMLIQLLFAEGVFGVLQTRSTGHQVGLSPQPDTPPPQPHTVRLTGIVFQQLDDEELVVVVLHVGLWRENTY